MCADDGNNARDADCWSTVCRVVVNRCAPAGARCTNTKDAEMDAKDK